MMCSLLCRSGSSGGDALQQIPANFSSRDRTADASVEEPSDQGEGTEGGSSRAKAAQTSAESPTASPGAGFAFAGSTDCPTPAPMGQKVSRPHGSTFVSATDLFASKSEQPAAEDLKQDVAIEPQQSQLLTEQCSTQPFPAAAAATAGEVSGTASPGDMEADALPATSAATAALSLHQNRPIRPQALLPHARARVCDSRSNISVPDPRSSADMDSADAAAPAPQSSGASLLVSLLTSLLGVDPTRRVFIS